ncbi:MAG: PEP-CTERM sorting domain-containing protein [Verrucomicrobiota bacterium]|jgi:hypothetical protein
MKYITTLASGTFVAFLGAAVCAHAQNLNGTLNSGFYGSALAVQTVNTGFGNAAGGNDSAGGSELDAAYGKISGGTLYLFLAGNVENNGNHLNVFIDGGAVGENTLNTSGGSLGAMNGSVFSPSFQATYAFDMNDYMGTLYNEEYNLVGGSQVSGGYVGSLAESSTGIAAGGFGGSALLYLNNNNASTMGAAGAALSGATSGLNTTTGLEMAIPLSAIGYTGGNIMVLADINGGGDSYLANQFLPGLAVGTGNVGGGGPYTGPNSGTFNFVNTPGEYFTISTVPEPSSMVMFGLSGLTALLAIRRRK